MLIREKYSCGYQHSHDFKEIKSGSWKLVKEEVQNKAGWVRYSESNRKRQVIMSTLRKDHSNLNGLYYRETSNRPLQLLWRKRGSGACPHIMQEVWNRRKGYNLRSTEAMRSGSHDQSCAWMRELWGGEKIDI